MLDLKKIVVPLICLIASIGSLSAQSKVIDIWNGEVPGAIQNDKFKQNIDTKVDWLTKESITEPRLYMYPAPAEKATGTAVVICPGGSYVGLAIQHEGFQMAQWFNDLGITAFVLIYRLPDDAIMENKSIAPLQDGQRAMRIVRSHAKEWGINPEKIGIMGFSAGGHAASTLSTHYNEKVYESDDTTSARPDFSLLIYPVISMQEGVTHMESRVNLIGKNPSSEQVDHFSNELQVNANTPPAFMVHSMDDGAVPVQNSINYALALKKCNVSCELHIYQSGGHGYGLGRANDTKSTWPEACKKWLLINGFCK